MIARFRRLSPRTDPALNLPPGVPSSLPWLEGLILVPLAILLTETGYLMVSASTATPALVIGLPMVGAVSAVMVGLWVRVRHQVLVELGTRAFHLPPAPDCRNPFPVPADDETGYLAAGLNHLVDRYSSALGEALARAAQLQRIFNSIDAGVVLADAGGRIVFVNPTAERMLGRAAGALVGRTVLECILSSEIASAVRRANLSGESTTLPFSMDGSSSEVMARIGPFGERLSGSVLVLQDREEQARLDAIRRDFIANVSHELRTPLASIRAMAETLAAGAREDPEVADSFLNIMTSEVDRLTRLTDDILDLARYESGRLECAPVDLSELLADVVQQVRPNAESAGLKLNADPSPLPVIAADRSALRQVVLNLLDNAIKYTPAGAISLSAEVLPGQEGPAERIPGPRPSRWVRLEVKDTGPGIPPEHLPRIFERFYRVDRGRSREMGGTGLGLSIVRHVAEAHGGAAEVASQVGCGSTFTVWLPVADESSCSKSLSA